MSSIYRTINPITGELVREFAFCSGHEVEAALNAACEAFLLLRRASFSERAQLFLELARRLEMEANTCARLMAIEMGKPIAQGEAEVRKCAATCRYFAEHGEALLAGEEVVRLDGNMAQVRFEPLGPVLAIMPWNYPFWQVFRCAVPAIMAGNVVLLKHAPNTPQCALAIEGLFDSSGFSRGTFRSLFLSNEQVEKVISDRRLAGVSFTGSVETGKLVGSIAARNLKKIVLELGGSDPFIVLKDADIAAAASAGARSRCANAGQLCCAAKRFIVDAGIFRPFVDHFLQEMESQVLGDPLDPEVTMGPLARADLKSQLQRQVERLVNLGATVISKEGLSLPPKGFFFAPLVLSSASTQLSLFQEELFGPVAHIVSFEEENEAISIANDTNFGLAASIWTKDVEHGKALARLVDAGNIVINGIIHSDPSTPFGGVKDSGFGRELGREGMREFVNIKAVWVDR
ncbi:MAG: aldehyde dehydrogenase family protein [Deltaproteobacteria bacterium]|nr:aldehyde dehydrogenase family protein [Deltaproteobacteria bacterium]